MCGIVGYVGNRSVFPILIKGLQRLEYRGYDSAGVGIISEEGTLNIYKTKGKVINLEESVAEKDCSGFTGIAHTRWATHGVPNQINAHPHLSESGNLVLVHNGIIENYAILKRNLEEKGFAFKSSTDTEVLVQYIDYIQQQADCDTLSALQLALLDVTGAYAIALIDKRTPDIIYAARKSSPLVIGVSNNEYFIGSDATPIIEYTNQVVYLEDEEIAILQKDAPLRIVNLKNIQLTPIIKEIELNLGQLEKAGFPHFMLKEIFEQPDCIRDCMRGRVNTESGTIALSAIHEYKDLLINAKRFIIVACGTSWHAALIGKQLIESFCRVPVEVEYASEFRYRNPVIGQDDVVIAISQSGETADTLAAVELAKSAGAFVYGICNVVGASIPRNTNTGSYIHVGSEIGVASTKAFTGQVTVLIMFALKLGYEKGLLSDRDYQSLITELATIPDKIEKVLELNTEIASLSQIFTYAHNFIYLGRGYNFPVALEGALKLKEISYIHAEGYPAAEMKHGPIALIDEEMPVVVIAPKTDLYDKIVSNVQEIKARKGRVIAIVSEGDTVMHDLADFAITIPLVSEMFLPLITTIPLQFMAYHIAVCKGKDVDQPRNLAKSVTVE